MDRSQLTGMTSVRLDVNHHQMLLGYRRYALISYSETNVMWHSDLGNSVKLRQSVSSYLHGCPELQSHLHTQRSTDEPLYASAHICILERAEDPEQTICMLFCPSPPKGELCHANSLHYHTDSSFPLVKMIILLFLNRCLICSCCCTRLLRTACKIM